MDFLHRRNTSLYFFLKKIICNTSHAFTIIHTIVYISVPLSFSAWPLIAQQFNLLFALSSFTGIPQEAGSRA